MRFIYQQIDFYIESILFKISVNKKIAKRSLKLSNQNQNVENISKL